MQFIILLSRYTVDVKFVSRSSKKLFVRIVTTQTLGVIERPESPGDIYALVLNR